MVELDYYEVKNQIIEDLEKHTNIVFSTCLKNKVTSRMMCFANDGLVLYLLTGKRSIKCKQIDGNENVSLCIDNIQIEGKAKKIGHPTEENNLEVCNIFKEKHSEYFKRFAHFKAAIFIEVKCDFMKQWRMEKGKDCFYFIDIVKEKAGRHN